MRLIACLALLLVCPFLLWARPVKIRAHVHTSEGSDGKNSAALVMKQAAEEGFDVLIVADHFEQTFARYPDFADYKALFDNRPLTNQGIRLLVIIGTEITAQTKDGQVHILAFPLDNWDERLLDSSQEKVLAILSETQKIAIIAHPGQPGYHFDKNMVNGLNGLEIFNDLPGTGGASFEAINYLLGFSALNLPMSVLGGADLHGVVTDKAERVDRMTIVDIPTISEEEVISAFQKNQTFATNFQVTINNFSIENKTIKFDVFAGWVKAINKTITVYRDGKGVADSLRIWLAGKNDYHYEWEDKNALPGEHLYVIHVSTCLVSSTLKMVAGAEQPVQSQGSFILPTLLAKTKTEVKQIFPAAVAIGYSFDQKGQMQDTTWGLCYLDRKTASKPKPGYSLNIYFDQNDQLVHSAALRDEDWLSVDSPGLGPVLSVRQVIPVEILHTTPSLIARFDKKDRLVVIWYIGNKTYAAVIKDSRPLYTQMGSKYVLTQNGRDFINADHLVFYGIFNRRLVAQLAKDNLIGTYYYILALGPAGNICYYLVE